MRERPISTAEFGVRVENARRAAHTNHWDGLLVVGRGGGTVDRLAQLWYLTDAYGSFPTIPDHDGVWWDRGCAAAIITPQKVILCGDSDTFREGGSVADEVMLGNDLPRLIADALVANGLTTAHLGLGGADALTFRQHQRLAERLPQLRLTDADAELMTLRMIKSPAEIELMRGAALIGAVAMRRAMEAAVPGNTEADYCAAGLAHVVASGGAIANAFAYAFGPEADDPRKRAPTYNSTRPLLPGDVATVDISGCMDGYFFDGARSRVVGAAPSSEQQRALQLAEDCVNSVVAELTPGTRVGDAATVGETLLDKAGYRDRSHERFQALGHGLGLGFEPPWVRSDCDIRIAAGMVIAIEEFVAIDGTGATFERTVVITDDGPHDLAPLDASWSGA
jgi:Xaa-Pro aminopeptidase